MWDDPEFVRFFRSFTPLDELGLLEIGSRPASRPEAASADELAALRAIPWVFSWTQTRCIAPAWLGAGAGLELQPVDDLRRLFAEWPFFRALVENLEMSLAKSSMEIAEGYLALVADGQLADRVFGALRDEHDRARDAVLEIVEARELLDRHPVLQQSVRLRNPYVDPMNAIQVELLRRYRSGEEEALDHCSARLPASRPRSATRADERAAVRPSPRDSIAAGGACRYRPGEGLEAGTRAVWTAAALAARVPVVLMSPR